MKIGKYILAASMVFGFAGMVYAAPVGLTSEADATESSWQYKELELSVGFVADVVEKRKIDIDSGEFEFNAFMARLGASLMDRFNIYVDLGSTQDASIEWVDKGDVITVNYEDEFIWGIGASAMIYRWDNGLEIGANVSYRDADLGIDKGSATVAGVGKTESQLTNVNGGNLEEIQGALELAWRTNFFSPYIGVKFSDVEVNADFKVDGQRHLLENKNSAENVGVFAGLEMTPKLDDFPRSKQVSINVEGRFIDEEAVSVGVNYRF